MTTTELTELLHRHVADTDPGEPMAVQAVVRRGQRRVRRRRVIGGTLGTALLTATLVLVPALQHGSGRHASQRIDPATTRALAHYDATAMPRLLDRHIRDTFPTSIDLGAPTVDITDSNGTALPRKDWGKASRMAIGYDAGDHRYAVALTHSKSSAEGGARNYCADMLSGGYSYSCTVESTAEGMATTSVNALVPLGRPVGDGEAEWAALTRSQIDRGITPPWLRTEGFGRRLDTSKVWFERTMKMVHSETFVTTVTEYVHAPSYAEAQRLWTVPTSSLETLSLDPSLVIPQPPMGSNGCTWMLHPEGVTCSKTVD